MTDTERIALLEKTVAMLSARIKTLEARVVPIGGFAPVLHVGELPLPAPSGPEFVPQTYCGDTSRIADCD